MTEPLAAGKVLVVEDDDTTRAVLVAVLTDEGYMVDAATDGRAAMLRLEGDGVPDVILVDMLMPTMDGLAFLRTYHARPGPHAPVVLITGRVMTGDEAIAVGAAGLLPKPFELDALLALVAQHTGRN